MITRKARITVGAVALLFVGGGVAYWLLAHGSHSAQGAQDGTGRDGAHAAAHGKAVRVHVVKPQQGGVARTVTRPGTVRPLQYARLFTKVSGYLEHQKVDIGSQVKQGELLADIYAPELEADVSKAAADLRKARAQVDVMKSRLDAAEADLKQAGAKVGQTEADVEKANSMLTLRQQEYKRISKLARQGALDKELVDEKNQARRAAEASRSSAEKAVATAKAAVVSATANVASAKADLEDARAQVEVAEAVLSRARTWQTYTQIRSPYTGIVTQRGYHDGDFIRAGTAGGNDPPVLTVARTDVMRIVVWVPDPDVPQTHAGLKAALTIPSMPDQQFTGAVSRTAGAEDPSTRAMRTEIDLPNPKDLLKEGMFGNVTIHLSRSRRGLTVPSACLFGPEKEHKRSVYVVKDGKAQQVWVLIGQNDGIRAEALDGLSADDLVVEQHDPGLAGGVPVEVVKGKL